MFGFGSNELVSSRITIGDNVVIESGSVVKK